MVHCCALADGGVGSLSTHNSLFTAPLFHGSVLMWRYTNIPSVVEDAGKKEKRCSLSYMCLEGLLRIFTTCQERYPEKMSQLLSKMGQTHTHTHTRLDLLHY